VSPNFEEEPKHLPLGVAVRRLRKRSTGMVTKLQSMD